jgi:hypothetical protein
MEAYERGLIAHTDQIWYRKVEQEVFGYGGPIKRNLTPEDIIKLKKN